MAGSIPVPPIAENSASLMLSAGVPLLVVSRQLGHANPHITAHVYAHFIGDEQLDAAAAPFGTAGRESTWTPRLLGGADQVRQPAGRRLQSVEQ